MQLQILDLFDSRPTFNNFIASNNEMVSNALQQQASQFTHVVGGHLSGKTHLLKAWVDLALNKHKNALYVDANRLTEYPTLRDLAMHYEFIAVDNISVLTDDQQISLFDLFNSIKLNNRNNLLLTSSENSLEGDATIREDLKTRILSGLNLTIKAPNDAELMDILAQYALNEGINIHASELNYLVNHYTRNIGTLINTMHKIVDIAMVEKRHITIPLIKQVLGQQ